jgi:hypothetical protein
MMLHFTWVALLEEEKEKALILPLGIIFEKHDLDQYRYLRVRHAARSRIHRIALMTVKVSDMSIDGSNEDIMRELIAIIINIMEDNCEMGSSSHSSTSD